MAVLRPVGHEERLSLVEHLDELRTRLIACAVVFMIAFSFCYWQNDRLLDFVNRPLESTQRIDAEGRSSDPLEQSARFQVLSARALRTTARASASLERVLAALRDSSGLSAAERRALAVAARDQRVASGANLAAAQAAPTSTGRQPVTLSVTEPFVTTFTVAGYAALLLCLPFLLWQAYAFVLPAFTPVERRSALPLMLLVPVLFIAGVTFGYMVALPRAIDFLQNFNDDSFDILLRASDFYRFSIVLLAVMGFLFQIPVGVIAVTRLGIVTPRQLAQNRGYVLLGISVVAAVATPTPDPVTMLLAMTPLVVLFELSLLLARVFERRSGRVDVPNRWDVDDQTVS